MQNSIDRSTRNAGAISGSSQSTALRNACRCRVSLLPCLAFFLFALAGAPAVLAQNRAMVDEILTLVNNEVITRSDLIWSLALDPKMPAPSGHLSSEVLRQKLEVMVDERLISQEAARVPGAEVSTAEIDAIRNKLIKQFGNENAFRQRVAAIGLTAERVDELLKQRILIDRFIDFRFRSFVFISEQEIQRYYDQELVPKLKADGQIPPPVKEVSDQISAILRQEKVNQEIDRWLAEARQRADIVQLAEPSSKLILLTDASMLRRASVRSLPGILNIGSD
jgi:hypothetical protein